MTTLTLRINLHDKTFEPAFAAEHEAVAVGETVRLRLLGMPADLTQAAANVSGPAGFAPALRARVLDDAFGDIAMYPFPGDTPAWSLETVEGESAFCCDLDLGTAQAYALFGGAAQRDGGKRKVRLVVEKGYPNANPDLYASDKITVGSWSFPGHALRVLQEPKGTTLTETQVQQFVDARIDAELATMREQIKAEVVASVNAEAVSAASAAIQAATNAAVDGAAELVIQRIDNNIVRTNAPATEDQFITEPKAFIGDALKVGFWNSQGSYYSTTTLASNASSGVVIFPYVLSNGINDTIRLGRDSFGNEIVTLDMLERLAEKCGYQIGVGGGNFEITRSSTSGISAEDVNDLMGRLLGVKVGEYDPSIGDRVPTYTTPEGDIPVSHNKDAWDALVSRLSALEVVVANCCSGLGGGSGGGSGGGTDFANLLSIIARLQVQLNALAADVAACCAGGTGGGGGGTGIDEFLNEFRNTINDLASQVNSLSARVDACCSGSGSGGNGNDGDDGQDGNCQCSEELAQLQSALDSLEGRVDAIENNGGSGGSGGNGDDGNDGQNGGCNCGTEIADLQRQIDSMQDVIEAFKANNGDWQRIQEFIRIIEQLKAQIEALEDEVAKKKTASLTASRVGAKGEGVVTITAIGTDGVSSSAELYDGVPGAEGEKGDQGEDGDCKKDWLGPDYCPLYVMQKVKE